MTHMYMHTCRNSHILSLIHNYTLIHLEILALALIHFPLTLTLTATLSIHSLHSPGYPKHGRNLKEKEGEKGN